MRQHGLHRIERTLDVEIEGFVEQVVVDFEKLCASYRGAGGIEKKLHTAEAVYRKLDHIFDGRSLGDVDGQGQRLAADLVDLLGRLFNACLVNVYANDIGFLTRKNKCRGATDPAGRACNKNGLAREIIR